MKKTYFLIILCLLINVLLFSYISVSADTGPKSFLDIEISNLPQSDYIVGLLIENEYYGPYRSFNNDSSKDDFIEEDYNLLIKVYPKIPENEQFYCSELITEYLDTKEIVFHIGYYPPSNFKLYLYDQANDKIYISKEYETYAFSSYYKCDFDNTLELSEVSTELILNKNYNYLKEILLFILRIILTLSLEVGIALLFKFSKKSLFIILYTNIGTQLLLNIALNLFIYNYGKNILGGIPLLLFGEIIIFIIEAIIYRILCSRNNDSKKLIIVYALVANLLSMLLSFIVWLI